MTRKDTRSALDFTYWIISLVEVNYDDGSALFIPSEDESLMRNVIASSASIVGIDLPRTMERLLHHVARQEGQISVLSAFRTRGAILHRNGIMHVSAGDGKRLVGIDSSAALSYYTAPSELHRESSWDGAFQIPEMVYA